MRERLGSAASNWAPLARFIEAERALGERAARRRWTAWIYEFLRFGIKQAWACLFGAAMLALLLGTHYLYPKDAPLARYDFLVVAALAIQIAMLAFRLETIDEAKVIVLFHVVGTLMEIFKTSVGSWTYPEPGALRIADVPLFSGFMYASVGSYIARVWRLFDFRFARHPGLVPLGLLSLAIYANFYTHHFVPDLRLALFGATVLVFGRASVHFRVWKSWRRMPLLVACGLTALFIWLAENVGTFANAWRYPQQAEDWTPVSVAKLGSWYLLLVISYTLVCLVNRREEAPAREAHGPISVSPPVRRRV
ncbi:MAG: DUF817 domain-containing protein [Alphaproteobacteria bacterium]|nr:DUF817 domain-containing protein [Alphaproteobacteria bacterium]